MTKDFIKVKVKVCMCSMLIQLRKAIISAVLYIDLSSCVYNNLVSYTITDSLCKKKMSQVLTDMQQRVAESSLSYLKDYA